MFELELPLTICGQQNESEESVSRVADCQLIGEHKLLHDGSAESRVGFFLTADWLAQDGFFQFSQDSIENIPENEADFDVDITKPESITIKKFSKNIRDSISVVKVNTFITWALFFHSSTQIWVKCWALIG